MKGSKTILSREKRMVRCNLYGRRPFIKGCRRVFLVRICLSLSVFTSLVLASNFSFAHPVILAFLKFRIFASFLRGVFNAIEFSREFARIPARNPPVPIRESFLRKYFVRFQFRYVKAIGIPSESFVEECR